MEENNGARAAEHIIQDFQVAKTNRALFESLWQDIADITIPRKNDIQQTQIEGARKGQNLFDSTAMTSCELLAGALHSMLTSPTAYFFNLSTGDATLDLNDNVRLWIQQVVRKMHDRLNNSNFQTEIHEYYLDLVAFGNGSIICEEDDKDVLRFGARPLKEITIKENSKGKIDIVYRSFKLDTRGLVDEYGLDELPEAIQKEWNEGKSSEYEMLHAIYPRRDDEASRTFRFVSQYILIKDKLTLSVKGFRDFPVIFGRWTKVSGEAYGRGCGEKALPDALTVNKMTQITLVGAQKVIDPPLQAPDDGFVLPLITRPGGLNYYRAGSQDRITPIFNDSRIDFGAQVIEQKQTKIREAFYVDQLKLREGPQMTATEVSERSEQALRFLSPMLGRQQSELLVPLVERVFAIMDRKGEFDDPPAELKDKPLQIRFSSVVAMAQRFSEMTSISRTFNALAPLAAMDPTVNDNVDTDQAFKLIARLQNFPQEMIRKVDDREQIRKSRQQAQAQAQDQQAQAAQADTTSKLMGGAAKMQTTGS